MILCRDNMYVSGEAVRAGGGCPPYKDILHWEERECQDNNTYITISDGSQVLERSLSYVGKSPHHKSDILHGTVASNTYTYQY